MANPTTPLSFKVEKDTEFRDTVVTLLIDNSGSMRGRPISIAAISADDLPELLNAAMLKLKYWVLLRVHGKVGKAEKHGLMKVVLNSQAASTICAISSTKVRMRLGVGPVQTLD